MRNGIQKDPRSPNAVVKLNRKADKKVSNALPPLCAVLAGGLRTLGSGGRPITPLGFQPKLTCTPEQGRAPFQYMLAQKHSANHEHSRGKPHKLFYSFDFAPLYLAIEPRSSRNQKLCVFT